MMAHCTALLLDAIVTCMYEILYAIQYLEAEQMLEGIQILGHCDNCNDLRLLPKICAGINSNRKGLRITRLGTMVAP